MAALGWVLNLGFAGGGAAAVVEESVGSTVLRPSELDRFRESLKYEEFLDRVRILREDEELLAIVMALLRGNIL